MGQVPTSTAAVPIPLKAKGIVGPSQRFADWLRRTLLDLPLETPMTANEPSPATQFGSTAPEGIPLSGGAADIGALYDVYAGDLLRYCCRILQDRARAEEAVQDTFVRAWRNSSHWDGRIGSQRTWLFSIAHNACIDTIRARNSRPPVSGSSVADVSVSGEPSLEAAMDGWLVEEALRRIREDQRVAIVETYIRGRSYGEVAAATGVNEATLRSRVFYGLKALRVALEELGWTA